MIGQRIGASTQPKRESQRKEAQRPRTAQTEHPGRFVLVDGPADAVIDALATAEEQTARRDDVITAPRLVAAAPEPVDLPEPNGTVLITGGLGALGRQLAQHLAEQGHRHLLLVGRRGGEAPDTGVPGVEVEVAACDVTDRDALAALLAAIPPERPLCGVFHAAGVLADATVEGLTDDQLDRVLAPKVDAAWNLHELVGDVAEFVLFSSVTGTVGTAGQANYAAANAYLDALARQRSLGGRRAVSLALGLWESGMGDTLAEVDQKRLARVGVTAMPADEGMALLDTSRRTCVPPTPRPRR